MKNEENFGIRPFRGIIYRAPAVNLCQRPPDLVDGMANRLAEDTVEEEGRFADPDRLSLEPADGRKPVPVEDAPPLPKFIKYRLCVMNPTLWPVGGKALTCCNCC